MDKEKSHAPEFSRLSQRPVSVGDRRKWSVPLGMKRLFRIRGTLAPTDQGAADDLLPR